MKAKRFILMLLVALMNITGAWAETEPEDDPSDPSGNITGTKMVVKKKNGDVTRFDANNIAKVECTTKKPAINKGKAKATINDSEVDVNWVQLWENGPKFAEYNVGANSATDVGTTMTFTDATKTGADYVWGANWCTPSQDDMQELLLAAQGNSSSKVTCNYCEFTQGDGKWGFKFTGKKPGYTDNSVFFPAQSGNSSYGFAPCWSATAADGSEAWIMSLYYYYGGWYGDWYTGSQDDDYLVRPMLEESSSERYVIVTEKDGTVTVFNFDEVQSVTWEMPAPEPEPTTGTAKATIGGDEVDVPWVQLWENGPKFAEFNVEGTFTFTQATANPFVWGSNWCTPRKNDMDELQKAAADTGSEKVTCTYTQESGVWGFKFTGKETGYTENSVFFPAQSGRSDNGDASFWSGAPSGDSGWVMHLDYKYGSWYGRWVEFPQYDDVLVRPVLAE